MIFHHLIEHIQQPQRFSGLKKLIEVFCSRCQIRADDQFIQMRSQHFKGDAASSQFIPVFDGTGVAEEG